MIIDKTLKQMVKECINTKEEALEILLQTFSKDEMESIDFLCFDTDQIIYEDRDELECKFDLERYYFQKEIARSFGFYEIVLKELYYKDEEKNMTIGELMDYQYNGVLKFEDYREEEMTIMTKRKESTPELLNYVDNSEVNFFIEFEHFSQIGADIFEMARDNNWIIYKNNTLGTINFIKDVEYYKLMKY